MDAGRGGDIFRSTHSVRWDARIPVPGLHPLLAGGSTGTTQEDTGADHPDKPTGQWEQPSPENGSYHGGSWGKSDHDEAEVTGSDTCLAIVERGSPGIVVNIVLFTHPESKGCGDEQSGAGKRPVCPGLSRPDWSVGLLSRWGPVHPEVIAAWLPWVRCNAGAASYAELQNS